MIRIAFAGAGGIAQRHAQAIASLKGAKLTAVTDIAPEKATDLASRYDAEAYDTLAACLPHADVVYVLTPPSTHRELTAQAVAAGKHVVVEKPIAIEIADAEAMVAAAADAGVKLMVAFNMRFRVGFKRLKEAVASGKLGEPLQWWSRRMGMGVGPGPNWRTTPGLLCGMSIESLSHDIDLMRWMVGDVATVKAETLASRPELPGFDDNAAALFALQRGGMGMIHASWSSHLGMNSRGVVGTEGTAMVGGGGLWDLDRFHLKTTSMAHETIEVLNDKLDVKSYREESRHFVDCVAHDRRPMVTGEDGLAALRISHAMLTSHREGTAVEL
jgi:myo-inositol 2-dehydrogenase/D-chiro-inositol 1-dehydrogenase